MKMRIFLATGHENVCDFNLNPEQTVKTNFVPMRKGYMKNAV